MKDLWNKIFRILIWLSLFIYLWYLFLNWISLIWNEWISSTQDYIVYIISGIIFLLFFYDGIKPICFNKPRIAYTLIWLFLIMFWYYAITNNHNLYLYIWDIMSLLWALITITWLAWMLTPNSCKQKIEKEKVEIIEA